MDETLLTKMVIGIGSVGAALYGAFRMFKKDRLDDRAAERGEAASQAANAAMMQVIETLRAEVDRLTKRLEAVEEQNRKCEARNDEMHAEILELKKQLQLA